MLRHDLDMGQAQPLNWRGEKQDFLYIEAQAYGVRQMNHRRVQISVKSYRGSKPDLISKYRARLEIARKIEGFINMRFEAERNGEALQIDYYEIASELGISKDDVKDILFANGGGSNGITLR